MKNKKFFIIWISLLVIIILALIIINLPKEEVYLDEPRTWIITKGAEKEIDVEKITEGTGFIDDLGQQLRTRTIETVFDYDGFYKGTSFRKEYIEEGKTIMKINQEMKSDDGIIEGFIVEKIENNEVYAYIFLDEDWKKEIPETNIFWGKDYQNEVVFSFAEVSNGIYMQKIKDDIDRFSDNFRMHAGGIIVGDLTRDDDKDKTLIRII